MKTHIMMRYNKTYPIGKKEIITDKMIICAVEKTNDVDDETNCNGV